MRYKEAETLKSALRDFKEAVPNPLSPNSMIQIKIETLDKLSASAQILNDAGSEYMNQEPSAVDVMRDAGHDIEETSPIEGPDLSEVKFIFKTTPDSAVVSTNEKGSALFKLSDNVHAFIRKNDQFLTKPQEQPVEIQPAQLPYDDTFGW